MLQCLGCRHRSRPGKVSGLEVQVMGFVVAELMGFCVEALVTYSYAVRYSLCAEMST